MAILGIDPGLEGGLALVNQGGSAVYEPMPTLAAKKGDILDLPSLTRWLKAHKSSIEIAYLEMVASRPGQSAPSVFKFGRGYGAIEGILTALEIPYQLVPPKQWCKLMHAGIEAADPKQKSLIAVSRLFPGIDLRATPRSKKPHDGMVDALLIASFGLRSRTLA